MSTGWQALETAVAEARALIAAAAPDDAVAAEGEAYVSRVMTAGLGGALLGHLFQEDGLSRPLPCHGGPNPDYRMRHAAIDAQRRYRLDGQINGSERVGVGLYSIGPNGAPLEVGYATFTPADCDVDGHLALTLAADAQGPGTLAIPTDARILLIRILHRDPLSEPARLRLEGGAQAAGPALATGSHDGALAFVARTLGNNVREYLQWTQAARERRNRLDQAPPELGATVQGDPDTQYYLGGFDLAEGEWLEVTMPALLSGYWSLHAYNYWYEHLQTSGVHDRNAVPDTDGRIRIAVGPDLPEATQNRIDTVGRRRGAFVCRMIGSSGCPTGIVRRLDREG
ncbi:hypothetical protein LWE61_07480 [Sphingobium sufflavum]|uniref:hypothetical protein n=1 Tax=Sphingobium sufflavum TaxID=1129547 RepID=UPI001F2336D6|nr:hypothetical protein [Sphingobium sufflavum]MCE7796402.1 hypothetical protein [Sphingobium sufflavum]